MPQKGRAGRDGSRVPGRSRYRVDTQPVRQTFAKEEADTRDQTPHGMAFGDKHWPHGEKDAAFDYSGYYETAYVDQFANYRGGFELRASEVKHVQRAVDILDTEPKDLPRAKTASRGRAQ